MITIKNMPSGMSIEGPFGGEAPCQSPTGQLHLRSIEFQSQLYLCKVCRLRIRRLLHYLSPAYSHDARGSKVGWYCYYGRQRRNLGGGAFACFTHCGGRGADGHWPGGRRCAGRQVGFSRPEIVCFCLVLFGGKDPVRMRVTAKGSLI